MSTPVRQITVGDVVLLSATATLSKTGGNCDNKSQQPPVLLTDVRDSDNVTSYLAWRQFNAIDASSSADTVNIGVSWVPLKADTYEIRMFVVNNLANPTLLSGVLDSVASVRPILRQRRLTFQYRFRSRKTERFRIRILTRRLQP